MKKKKRTKSIFLPGQAEALVVFGILLAVILVIIIVNLRAPAEEPPEIFVETVPAEETEHTILAPEITLPLPLAEGISLTGLYTADALFPEDGSNTPAENLLCAVVRNDSDRTLEYIAFTLRCGEVLYEFSVTTLPPSCEVYTFEKNAAKAPDRVDELIPETQVYLFFAEEPVLHKEQLEITVHDGSIDVKNISDAAIGSEIQVYYKNTENLAYFGGITYFFRVPAGLAPGATYNGYAANASTARTEVMFVKYGS